MSSTARTITLARANDAILGSFALAHPSETLDHLVRYLGTWSGSDKLFMVLQYATKLIIPFLKLRARLQHRAGLRKTPDSQAAESGAKLVRLLGDSRTLWRIWGLLPIVQWLISLERKPQSTRNILTIERLQGWSMLSYYPLELIYFLLSHDIIPTSFPSPLSFFSNKKRRIHLDPHALALLSCRFWAVYVFLQFAHLREDWKLLQMRCRTLRKVKGSGGLTLAEKDEIKQRKDAFWSEVAINAGYLPLTIHWSLKKGLFKNEVWVGLFGFIAAVASLRSGWRATALPPFTSDESDAVCSPDNSIEKGDGGSNP